MRIELTDRQAVDLALIYENHNSIKRADCFRAAIAAYHAILEERGMVVVPKPKGKCPFDYGGFSLPIGDPCPVCGDTGGLSDEEVNFSNCVAPINAAKGEEA